MLQEAGASPSTATTGIARLATHKTRRGRHRVQREGRSARQGGTPCGRTPLRGGRRFRHGGPRARVCVGGGVKSNKHGTARTAAAADSKRQPAGDRGRSPAHQRRVPHVLQSNGICHWTCARADEPDPAEGSAVTEPVPKPQTAAKPRGPQQTTARRGTGGKTCRSPEPQRHSPHATRHYGETWCTPSATGSREGPMAGRAL